jgi:hypothetical protein
VTSAVRVTTPLHRPIRERADCGTVQLQRAENRSKFLTPYSKRLERGAQSSADMADIPLYVKSDNAASERRITPSWAISQLKAKLEPMTGIPPSAQRLSLKVRGSETIAIEAQDEDAVYLSSFPLVPYAELHVRQEKHPFSFVPQLYPSGTRDSPLLVGP